MADPERLSRGGRNPWRAREARAYNGGLGAEPPAGSRGRARGQGVRGAKPPEAESILVIGCPTEPANLAPFQKCICIFTLGATVMIWEKFMSKSGGGAGDPPCPFLGAPMIRGQVSGELMMGPARCP